MNIDLQARQIQPLRHTFARVATYTGDGKPASRYQEATLGAQPTHNFHYRPTWEPEFELFDPARTAIRMADWNVLRDPRQYYYATWTMTRARQQEAVEANYKFVQSRDLIARMPSTTQDLACQVLMPLRHVAWAGNMNNSQICARGYGAPLTAPALMHALDHLSIAQYLTRLGLVLGGPEVLNAGKQDWMDAPGWQALRRHVEDTLVIQDPLHLMVAQNLALDGLLYPLIYTHFVDDHLTLKGGSAVAMLCSFMTEWHLESSAWVDAVLKTCAAESQDNARLLGAWYGAGIQAAQSALSPIANLALGEDGPVILQSVREQLNARAQKLGFLD
ncbi:Phenol hydroxylase, P1 oxygenase component DmpL OS=Castellaniella defragrans (strain DSM / CCUG 39792 / 65Phen) OX=1437824 GN=BN940_04361 PE=4 SV=1 [Castellaniella denitrificans]